VGVLLIGSKTAAVNFEFTFKANTMSLGSIISFHKLAYLRDDIMANIN
jgi:hypothetical protein